jgi:hypothetical protein
VPKRANDPAHAILAADIAKYCRDPLGYVRYSFPKREPRKWQAGILQSIGDHFNSPKWDDLLQISVASGHGIGKSALVGMIISWAMSTCPGCKMVITANTFDQLRTKTWPEVTKWVEESATFRAGWWELTATALIYQAQGRDTKWRADAIPWSEKTEAFQGLHNKDKRIVLVFDEASAIDDGVWEVAEGAFTDSNTEKLWIAFGNPTRPKGRFFECFNRFKHRWKPFQIDSRTVDGTNKEQIGKWVEDYGEDSDFVRVRVRGEFPRAGSNQFIASDVVSSCRKYKAMEHESFPKILGVDVARFGDDQTVWFERQGRKSLILKKARGLDTAQVAAQTVQYIDEREEDAVVVDSDGIGAPVFDQLKFRGYGHKLYEFHGGKPANNHAAYFNRRAEVWGLMRDWLNAGAEVPDDPELETDLTAPQYGFSAQQQVQLEKKDDMKKRGLSSPDCGDALAMTFAVNILKRPSVQAPVYAPGPDSWMA